MTQFQQPIIDSTCMLEQNLKETYDTKLEQVDASVRFVLQDEAEYYDALENLPARVKAAVLYMVVNWMEPAGYHYRVLKAGMRQFLDTGFIAMDEPPFTDDELNS